ncbi:MAG: hypothetical protein KAT16_04350 [Candidatus Heimdallarchaeota archaeon]|nr:hypothetical protein [Candidatus Heimdallarchaeota archaeon]
MSLIDVMGPAFELIFPFIVIILVFLVWRAIRSFWSQEIYVRRKHQFIKGKTEYWDPARPYSESFYAYLQLAFMTTQNRQQQLVKQLSDRLKETKELHPQVPNKTLSSNLSLLMEDSEEWLKNVQKKISSIRSKRRKLSSDILYEEILQILIEVNSLYDIQILPNLE